MIGVGHSDPLQSQVLQEAESLFRYHDESETPRHTLGTRDPPDRRLPLRKWVVAINVVDGVGHVGPERLQSDL